MTVCRWCHRAAPGLLPLLLLPLPLLLSLLPPRTDGVR